MLLAQGEVVSNHDELMCNFFAQADALAMGKTPIELRAQVQLPLPMPSDAHHPLDIITQLASLRHFGHHVLSCQLDGARHY